MPCSWGGQDRAACALGIQTGAWTVEQPPQLHIQGAVPAGPAPDRTGLVLLWWHPHLGTGRKPGSGVRTDLRGKGQVLGRDFYFQCYFCSVSQFQHVH